MKEVFLTGLTGVLGSALAPILLNDPEVRLHVPVREKHGVSVANRIAALRSFWQDAVNDSAAQRLIVYTGDVSRPRFDLAPAQYEELSRTITHIIHSAAAVKLDMSPEEAMRRVYLPSEQVIHFASALHEKGRLKKFEYISTLGVAGKLPGSIPESTLPPREFHNEYERTKNQSEVKVLALQQDIGLPVTVHRPSMIIGNSESGAIPHFQGFYFLMRLFSGQQTRGFVPDLSSVSFDLIPADFVAKSIVAALVDPATAGRIFHECSGDRAMSFDGLLGELDAALAKQKLSRRNRKLLRPQVFLKLLTVGGLITRNQQLKKIAHVIGLYFKHIHTRQQFENKETLRYLAEQGIYLPLPGDYVPKALEYYFASAGADR